MRSTVATRKACSRSTARRAASGEIFPEAGAAGPRSTACFCRPSRLGLDGRDAEGLLALDGAEGGERQIFPEADAAGPRARRHGRRSMSRRAAHTPRAPVRPRSRRARHVLVHRRHDARSRALLAAEGYEGEVLDSTPVLHRRTMRVRDPNPGETRCQEIQQWLDSRPARPESFVILDDIDLDMLAAFQVKTDAEAGLLDEHVETAVPILGEA
ncbi:HAD domain-containing protein [Polyangium sp. 6x1]|uniref:HAD domain-containing protein n=1 Tax=Polyangium sp. 6x1 TaxID=3042689 RepID=UPI002482CBD4|nr:HAD domain-containing protein [Polyangium sp. 6x1]MDI1445775.1 HAD domain-containing protein [Polyangium sp. 6x1]